MVLSCLSCKEGQCILVYNLNTCYWKNLQSSHYIHTIYTCAGWDPQQFLPDIHLLLSADIMRPLTTDKQAQYLLGAVYELVSAAAQGTVEL